MWIHPLKGRLESQIASFALVCLPTQEFSEDIIRRTMSRFIRAFIWILVFPCVRYARLFSDNRRRLAAILKRAHTLPGTPPRMPQTSSLLYHHASGNATTKTFSKKSFGFFSGTLVVIMPHRFRDDMNELSITTMDIIIHKNKWILKVVVSQLCESE